MHRYFLVAVLALLSACKQEIDPAASSTMATDQATEGNADASRAIGALGVDDIAQAYVPLVLALGVHDPDYVDAYLGPDSALEKAKDQQRSLVDIKGETERLIAALKQAPTPTLELPRLRQNALAKRLLALLARVDLVAGTAASFDQESQLLYDAVAPDRDAAYFEAVLAEIDALLPGDDPLPKRVENFRQRFVIPPAKLATVFNAAIQECRRRTLEHIALPDNENFRIEYVTDKPWSGYNWYQGNAFSLIQINVDLPIFIERAVDLGCHEGYPGHHTYNALLERNLVDQRGWVEFSVYPLFSPISLISEGSANYGIEMAFPGDQRIEFERTVLFPLAGLAEQDASMYYRLQGLLQKLSYAGNEAARDYLNGRFDRSQAIDWLVKYSLSSPERAAQRVDFFDKYRSYVINYNLGKDIVADYVERTAGDDPIARWTVFSNLLSAPYSPSDLIKKDP